MKYIKSIIIVISLILSGTFIFVPAEVGAVDACSGDNANTLVCKNQGDSIGKIITNVINVLLFVVGAVSVLMIILSGIWYVISQGESSHVKRAKDTLLYAVIGLIVALIAAAIVNFVLAKFMIKTAAIETYTAYII